MQQQTYANNKQMQQQTNANNKHMQQQTQQHTNALTTGGGTKLFRFFPFLHAFWVAPDQHKHGTNGVLQCRGHFRHRPNGTCNEHESHRTR